MRALERIRTAAGVSHDGFARNSDFRLDGLRAQLTAGSCDPVGGVIFRLGRLRSSYEGCVAGLPQDWRVSANPDGLLPQCWLGTFWSSDPNPLVYKILFLLVFLVRPAGFEPATY